MEENQSLYNYIEEHVVDGVLPDGFSLPEESANELQTLEGTKSQLRFADGALDGMMMYHMQQQHLGEEELNNIKEALFEVSNGNVAKAVERFVTIAKQHPIITIIDEIQQCIMNHDKDLNARNLYNFAADLLLDSNKKELVKVGLTILELFQANDALKDAVRMIGLSDEFTIFAVFLMRAWENANTEIFKLAKKVKGWGRIHAIEFMEPETDEMRTWLLTEGIHNEVLSEYSALTCYHKAGVEQLLSKDNLTKEEFHAIAEIVSSLVVEGPVPGISEIENATEVMTQFLKHAAKQKLTDREYEIVANVSDWEKEKSDTKSLEIEQLADQFNKERK